MISVKCDHLWFAAPKKRFSESPVAVIVDDCPYWIGFHPLAWVEAERSCDTVNASLVVLDSPKTIAHMMTLMLENRAGKQVSEFLIYLFQSSQSITGLDDAG